MSDVVTSLDGRGVASLTLNRPEVRNAFNAEVMASITDFVRFLPQEARLLVLSGNGKVFSAGADLNWMSKISGYSEEENVADASVLLEMLNALDESPVPVIGKVQGAAVAGALGLVSCCDYVVCDEAAWFATTEVRLGLVPAVISPFVLRKLPYGLAAALFLSAERFPAERAFHAGLVHKLVPRETLDEATEEVIGEFLRGGPQALRATRKLLGEVRGRDPYEVGDLTVKTIAERRVSTEGQEGVKAFLEKRDPNWIARQD